MERKIIIDNKHKKENDAYWGEQVVADEMQKTLSFELEHKSLWLWYILNSFSMFFAMFIFIGTEDPAGAVPPSIQILLLVQYGIMYFCLSLYNIRAAQKGVLDSFSRYQKGTNGLKYTVAALNLTIPMTPVMSVIITKLLHKSGYENMGKYLTFFIVWFCMSYIYECISWYCVRHNKKVRDSIAADDEETEEE